MIIKQSFLESFVGKELSVLLEEAKKLKLSTQLIRSEEQPGIKMFYKRLYIKLDEEGLIESVIMNPTQLEFDI